MEFEKEKWTNKDIIEFNKYLESIKKADKIEFTKRTVNTNMETLGIPTPTLKEISKNIAKGNYLSFLDKFNNKYYENTIINVCLINKIQEIEKKKYYFENLTIDNWATVDAMTFKIKGKEKEYLTLAREYINRKEPFFRRIGVRILFNFTETEYLDDIFKIIDFLYNEQEYYVNMAVAWLMCEIIIKNRDKGLKYLKNRNLNKFTNNKAISKCRDSFRVSDEDKEELCKFRIK